MPRTTATARKRVSRTLIDTDLPPKEPDGCRFIGGELYGTIEWDPKVVHLFQGKNEHLHVQAVWVYNEAAKRNPLNATILDFLLENPKLIPEHWRENERGQTRFIYFCGSRFRDGKGFLWVRYLYWDKEEKVWRDGLVCLSRNYLHSDGYAAVFLKT